MNDLTQIHQSPLIQLLSMLTSPERIQEIENAISTLYVSGGSQLEDQINQLYENVVQLPQDEILTNITEELFRLARYYLQQYHVTLDEDHLTPDAFETMIGMLFALQNLEDYEDLNTLYPILDLYNPPKEIFADVVQLISDINATAVLDIVDDVSPQLIENAKRLVYSRYKEETRRLKEEALSDKKENQEVIRRKKEHLYAYIDELSKGDDAVSEWFKKYVKRMINEPVDALFERTATLVTSRRLSVSQHVGLWAIAIHLANFIDVTSESEGTHNRYRQAKEMISKTYEDKNLLFTVSHRVDEVINVKV